MIYERLKLYSLKLRILTRAILLKRQSSLADYGKVGGLT